ncbi:hypothetical protein DL768_008723 [Monosporascus sp. mg162]|nr:hypothetical protein DL768_008723 [Monosporascus sp. mg162]
MPNLKPITVWSLGGSLNPWKAIIFLEKLGLPYEVKRVWMAEIKQEPTHDTPANINRTTGFNSWLTRPAVTDKTRHRPEQCEQMFRVLGGSV